MWTNLPQRPPRLPSRVTRPVLCAAIVALCTSALLAPTAAVSQQVAPKSGRSVYFYVGNLGYLVFSPRGEWNLEPSQAWVRKGSSGEDFGWVTLELTEQSPADVDQFLGQFDSDQKPKISSYPVRGATVPILAKHIYAPISWIDENNTKGICKFHYCFSLPNSKAFVLTADAYPARSTQPGANQQRAVDALRAELDQVIVAFKLVKEKPISAAVSGASATGDAQVVGGSLAQPGEGELRLDGALTHLALVGKREKDDSPGTLTFSASSFTTARGRSAKLPAPRKKVGHLDGGTQLVFQGKTSELQSATAETLMNLKQLLPCKAAIVIKTDGDQVRLLVINPSDDVTHAPTQRNSSAALTTGHAAAVNALDLLGKEATASDSVFGKPFKVERINQFGVEGAPPDVEVRHYRRKGMKEIRVEALLKSETAGLPAPNLKVSHVIFLYRKGVVKSWKAALTRAQISTAGVKAKRMLVGKDLKRNYFGYELTRKDGVTLGTWGDHPDGEALYLSVPRTTPVSPPPPGDAFSTPVERGGEKPVSSKPAKLPGGIPSGVALAYLEMTQGFRQRGRVEVMAHRSPGYFTSDRWDHSDERKTEKLSRRTAEQDLPSAFPGHVYNERPSPADPSRA